MLDLLPVSVASLDALPSIFANGSRNRIHKLVLEVDEMYRVRDSAGELVESFGRLDQPSRIRYYVDNPDDFESNMDAVLPYVTVLLNCIVWSNRYPRTITRDLMEAVWRTGTPLKAIGDITCDPNGSIEFSKETWIDDPVFTYDPTLQRDLPGIQPEGIAVMAVTNLPCEFSRDASIRFSHEIERFLPELIH
ncbi:MAG: hypothetical protein R3282_08675, partial [Rhodothermales bacterium]|nr:hypothetical protein [Rhodothermales bacterium]